MSALIQDDDPSSMMVDAGESAMMNDVDNVTLAPLPKARRLIAQEHLEQLEKLKRLQVKVEQLQQLLDQTMEQLGKTDDRWSPEADKLRAEIAQHSASIRVAIYRFGLDLRKQMEAKIPAPERVERVSGRPRRPLLSHQLESIHISYFDR